MENDRDALMQRTTRLHLAMEAEETLRRIEEFPDNPVAMGYFYDLFRNLFTHDPVLPEADKVIGMCRAKKSEWELNILRKAGAKPAQARCAAHQALP